MNDLKQERQLQLITTQQYETHQNVEEETVQAVVARRNGTSYISFTQKIEEYNVEVKNLIKIKDGIVTIKRSGALTSTMVFDINKEYFTDYETPYGMLDVRVKTKSVESLIFEEATTLEISYEMMMQGKKVSDNRYCIKG